MLEISRTPEFQKWKMIMEHFSERARHLLLSRITDAYFRNLGFHIDYPTAWKPLGIRDYTTSKVHDVELFRWLEFEVNSPSLVYNQPQQSYK